MSGHTSWSTFLALRAAKRRVSLDIRENFGADYKVRIGHTIWDNRIGALLDLENTPGWIDALEATSQADYALVVGARHAYQGQIVAWRTHPENGDPYVWYMRPLDSDRRDR